MIAERVSKVIGEIYSTVRPGAEPRSPMDVLRDAVGAEHVVIRASSRGRTTDLRACTQLRSLDLKGFETAWNGSLGSTIRLQASGRSMRMRDLFPGMDILASEVYQSLFKPIEGGLSAFYCSNDSDELSQIAICRSAERGRDFNDDSLQMLDCLMPHVASATALLRSSQRTQQIIGGIQGAFDAFNDGVILIDRRSRVLHANTKARALAERGDIHLSATAIRASQPDEDAALQEAIRSVVAFSETGRLENGNGMLASVRRVMLSLADGRPAAIARVVPVTAGLDWPASQSLGAVIVIRMPGDITEGHSLHIAEQFALSPREAELAIRFCQSANLAEVAAAMGIRPQTARQYLKAVFAKTGTSSQARLLRLIGE